MDFKSKLYEAEQKANNASDTNKILDLMDKLRLSSNDNSQRRWIWELLQNAKDVAFENEKVDVEINLDNGEGIKRLCFSHNGKPFNSENIIFLIKQVSSKERTKPSDNEKPKTTGKFGTGFLSTHLLSEIVSIRGFIAGDDSNFLPFELPLDRSGRTPDELTESIKKSKEIIHNVNSNSSLNSINTKDLNTTFTYDLNNTGYKVALKGLEDLHLSIPYTLCFLDNINTINIKHENIKYELIEPTLITDIIKVFTINKTTIDSKESIYIVTLTKDNVTIAVEVEIIDDIYYIKEYNENLPRLFCDFPLIGTHEFHLPILINSWAFNPTEPRDGIWLKDDPEDGNEDDKLKENKRNILLGLELYKELLKYAGANNWQNLYYLIDTQLPKEKEWFSKTWISKNIQQPIREFIRKEAIIDNINIERKAFMNSENKPLIFFPSSNKEKIVERIWEVCKNWLNSRLPQKKELHQWNRKIWEDSSKLSLKLISDSIQSKINLEALTPYVNNNTIEETVIWLNQFYDLLNEEGEFIKHIIANEYSIIPNQNGILKKPKELFLGKEIHDEFKDILLILGKDLRNDLRRDDIITHSRYKDDNEGKILYNIKGIKEVVQDINSYIKENKHPSLTKACNRLLAIRNNDSLLSKIQEELYKYCSIIDSSMPQDIITLDYSENIWQEVNIWQINRIIKFISSQNCLDNLSSAINQDKENTLDFLSSFIEFLGKNYKNLLDDENSKIFPNQYGDFNIKKNLYLDNGDIAEQLKDICKSLDYDIRKELLLIAIFIESDKVKTGKHIAEEITTRIKPKLSEVPRSEETNNIFSKIIIWFDDNKREAEELFTELYPIKHKLYDDAKIAQNLKNMEHLESLFSTHAIRDINHLADILSNRNKHSNNYYSPRIKKELDDMELISSGLTSMSDINNIHSFYDTYSISGNIGADRFEYVKKIINTAVRNVLIFLKQNPRYTFPEDISQIMTSCQTPTVITGIKKDNQDITLVIRPSNNNKICLYYNSEFDALLLENTEFWIDNNRDNPELVTIGKLLRYLDITTILLK